MARFSKEEFLQADYTDALDTERTLFPAGECVGETIEDFKIHDPKSFTDKDGNQQEGSPQLELKIRVREDHAVRVRELLGYAEDRVVYFSHRFWLEITEDGYLDFGPNKNLALGQVRAALGQNNPGETWSFNYLRGAGPLAWIVKHEDWEKDGKKGTSERVTKWAAVI